MANSQHVELLRKGVDAWNESRRYQDFTPDLSDEDIAQILRDSLITTDKGQPDLSSINLSNALLFDCNLSETSLFMANLRDARLQRAQLQKSWLLNADLTQASLRDANLTSAMLLGAKLWQADLEGSKLVNAQLGDADLVGAKLKGSRFWRANMVPISLQAWGTSERAQLDPAAASINEFLNRINEIKKFYSEGRYTGQVVFYYRGESKATWSLTPSVMRSLKGKQGSLRHVEGEMLVDLISRRAEDFGDATSALDQMVIARHHGLPTRLLDVTRNPLVALFHASEQQRKGIDGRIHVFGVPKFLVKQFDSDTVSVIANFARLRRGEQNLILGKIREDTEGDINPSYGDGSLQLGDEYSLAMNRLYQFIRLEKPSFQERINPIDLFRVIVVEPQKSFERIRAQSGAFLISPFHERFEGCNITGLTPHLPIYHHYTLDVPECHKNGILEDLATLNISRETLLPGLDEAARAVKEQHSNLT